MWAERQKGLRTASLDDKFYNNFQKFKTNSKKKVNFTPQK